MTAESSSTRFQRIVDRVEIDTLRAEFTDAVMMRDYDRLAALFTTEGTLRIPGIPDMVGDSAIRTWGAQVPDVVEYLLQTAHPGTILLDGDTASGRVFIEELISLRDGQSGLNYAIYHDRYQRTSDGWKFTERAYEIKYLDTLTGSPPPSSTDTSNGASSGGR
jgi:hypothetical protein